MLPDGFKVDIFKNRAEAANKLAERCKVAKDIDRKLWHEAWDRFTVDSYSQIPEYPTFPISYKNSKQKRKEYKLEYKLECIRRFLPRLKEKHNFLTGAAKKSNENLIMLLESWKTDLPPGTVIKFPARNRDNYLQIPEKPKPIVLPLPPTFKKFARRPTITNRKMPPPTQSAPCGHGQAEPPGYQGADGDENSSWDDGRTDFEEHSLPSEFCPSH